MADNGSLYEEAERPSVLLFALPKGGSQQKSTTNDKNEYATTSYILNKDFIEAIKSGQAVLKPTSQTSQSTTTNNVPVMGDICKITDYTGSMNTGASNLSKPVISSPAKSQSQQAVTNQNNTNSNSSSNYNLYSVSNYTLNSNEVTCQGNNGSSQYRTTITKDSVQDQHSSMPLDLAANPPRASEQKNWSGNGGQSTNKPYSNLKTIDLANTPISALWNTEVLPRNKDPQRKKMEESNTARELAERIRQSAMNKGYKMNSNDAKTSYNNISSSLPSSSSNAKSYNTHNTSRYQGDSHASKHKISSDPYTQHQPTDYSQSKMIKIESRHEYKSNDSSTSSNTSFETKKSNVINFQDFFQQTIQQTLAASGKDLLQSSLTMAATSHNHLKNNLKHKIHPTEYPKNLSSTPDFSKKKVSKVSDGKSRREKKSPTKKMATMDPVLSLIVSSLKNDFQNGHSQTSINKIIQSTTSSNNDLIQPTSPTYNIIQPTTSTNSMINQTGTNTTVQSTSSTNNMSSETSTSSTIQTIATINNIIQEMATNNTIKQEHSESPEIVSDMSLNLSKECSTAVKLEAAVNLSKEYSAVAKIEPDPSSDTAPVSLPPGPSSSPTIQPAEIKKEPRKYIRRERFETRDPYFQDTPCYEVQSKLPRCRDCRQPPAQRNKDAPNICCRFYAFRKLLVDKKGYIRVAGFADPIKDAKPEDAKLWSADFKNVPKDLTVEKSKFLLSQVAYKFCEIYHQEKEAYYEHLSEDKTVAWKQPVKGVRELCDVCETTLFNLHWVCKMCGFVVCLDCYKGRKHELRKESQPKHDRRDEYNWLLCHHRVPHEQNKLMITQIIPGDCLYRLVRQVHGLCALLEIPLNCECPFSKELQFRQLKNKFEFFYHKMVPEKEPTKVLVSIKSITSKVENSEITCQVTYTSNIVEEKIDQNLEKESYNFNGFQKDILVENGKDEKTADDDVMYKKIDSTTLNAILKQMLKNDQREMLMFLSGIGQDLDNPPNLDDISNEIIINDEKVRQFVKFFFDSFILDNETMPKENLNDKDFVLDYMKKIKTSCAFLNKGERVMSLDVSQDAFPNVPHNWLCHGKLLRLFEPLNVNNYRLFHDQWERGQPVIVSNVSENLDKELWKPSSFIKDFGDKPNDLINCLNGKLIKNQLMKHFWLGFEREEFRLLDEKDNPMILKLKDWPPGDDFAEMLPTRFTDLMKILPLKEYTLREGRLNLASRLPEFFLPPDLGPKMYNAYGSAFHHKKSSTNLHLDISDAANVMVYCTAPRNQHFKHYMKQVWESIQDEIDDENTVKRLRTNRELPGALWHIYHPSTTDTIRDFLKKIEQEKGGTVKADHDPIHDQKWYLDKTLRERLKKEHNVEGYTIIQFAGDAVFIPAGAPHQVRNILNCVKVAEDFVSPENIYYCCKLTNEFRYLTRTHSNHEDKLQIKNIIFHTVKDAVSCIVAPIMSSIE